MLLLLCLGSFIFKSPIFIQERVGRFKSGFKIIKFRSMKVGTRSVGTHLINRSSIPKYGAFLRHFKLDEILQLFNVLLGHMSIVGPRPCLFNQSDVIVEREKLNIFQAKPGITGLSQIRKITMENPIILARTDYEMMIDFSLIKYIKIIILTIFGCGKGDALNN